MIYLEEDDRGVVSDEPYSGDATTYDRIRAWADIFHHPDPADAGKRFRFLVAGDSIYPSAPYADLTGAVDVWDQYLDEVDQNAAVYRQRFASFPGEELWLVANGYGDFIDYPALYHRALGFFAWKTGATGLEHWSSIAWFDAGENPVSPWNPANLTPVWGWGAGAVLWPGHNIERRGISLDGPLPSLRLELNRQAFEDYELLKLLADAGHGELAAALATAAVPTRLWDGLKIDRDQFERCRAAAIVALTTGANTTTIRGTVRDPSGDPLTGVLVGNGTFAAASEADGTYELTVPTGAITLNATADRHRPATVTLAAGQTDAAFMLSPLATTVAGMFGSFETAGEIWDAENATVALASAHATEGSKALRVTFLDTAGEAVIYPRTSSSPPTGPVSTPSRWTSTTPRPGSPSSTSRSTTAPPRRRSNSSI